MAKDVNIHVKTQGTEQAKQDLQGVAQTTEEMGAKSSRAAGWIKEAFTALVGPLGIAAIVGLVVAGIRKIIAAFDDMKRASAEAVQELANQQRAAGSFFEAVNAYSGPQRKAALAQARGVQATTGLPFESSMQLLEAQQRTFGEINPQSTEQFAAFWQLHGKAQTPDLIRWMGESGIKTPERQGQIMRIISAVAGQNKLKDEDIIQSLASQGERFRYLGWSPEETITNIGKVLTPGAGQQGITRLFGALENFTEEKALELKAPPKIASSEQARLEWAKTKAAGMSPDQRDAFMHKAFGPQSPYVTKLLFEPTTPAMQQAIDYATSPQAATEEAKNAAAYKKTAEGRIERARGSAGVLELTTTREQEMQAAIREYGKQYLEFLRRNNFLLYEAINLPRTENAAIEKAAELMWWGQKPGSPASFRGAVPGPSTWKDISLEQRLGGLESAARKINIHYHNEIVYNPVAGTAAQRDIGPRATRDFK